MTTVLQKLEATLKDGSPDTEDSVTKRAEPIENEGVVVHAAKLLRIGAHCRVRARDSHGDNGNEIGRCQCDYQDQKR